jgi:hypothetical protein
MRPPKAAADATRNETEMAGTTAGEADRGLAYCCAGCAVAARVPVDAEGNFPVNVSLVRALVVGFLFFNEVLFATVALLVQGGERAAWSPRFGWMAATAGLLVWAGVVFVHRAERATRGVDVFVFAVTAVLHVLAFWKLPRMPPCWRGVFGVWSGKAFRAPRRDRPPSARVIGA